MIDAAVVGEIFTSGMVDGNLAQLLVEEERISLGFLNREVDRHNAVVTVHDYVMRLFSVEKTQLVLVAVVARYVPGVLCHGDVVVVGDSTHRVN